MAKMLPYQRRWVNDRSAVKVWRKSRRIGCSWSDARDSALVAAKKRSHGGMSTYYTSYNKDMTAQYVHDTASYAKKANLVASNFEEIILNNADQDATIYQVRFASGNVVQGLSSNPNNLRSKQGRVRIDEAAFVENLPELLKAAIALTMWGGDVGVMSTLNGEDNDFCRLCQDIEAGRLDYSLHHTDLDDALEQGLYKAICEARGLEWSPAAELAWRAKLIADYGEGADEELFCIPSKSGGAWLNRNLIEANMDPSIPVIRWTPPADDFVDWPVERAYRETRDWLEAVVLPLLEALPKELRHNLGGDFGRSGDLSCQWPVTENLDLSHSTPFVLELRNVPFRTQEQVLSYICDRLPRMSGIALDARGNGQSLAEFARQRYGQALAAEVMLSTAWYQEHMPRAKAAMEDRTWSLPKDALILDDFRGLKVVNGIPRVPDARTGGKGSQRHCDSAVAGVLALYAATCMERLVEWSPPVTAGTRLTPSMMRGYRI